MGDEDAIAVIYSHPDVDNFHNYILQQAKLSDDEAIEVIYSHPNDADFRDYILQQAKAGDYDAKNIVLENPAIALFQEYICKLVSSSDEGAKAVVLSNVKYDLFRKCIVELTLQGDHEAKKVALANVKYDIFQNCVVELALQGDCNAKKAILENYEIKLFQECVCKLALNDDVDAKKVVQINYENYESFQKCMVNCALQGDDCFARIIYEISEKIQDKAGIAIAKIFRGFIVSEARQNEERALKCVEADPQNEKYKDFLIEKCLEKDEWALTIICSNLGCYGPWINEIIKSQCEKNNLKGLLVEKILHQAKSDDNALKYVVCENPQEEKFKNLIVERIQQNKDVFECIYRHYLRETSSCYGEFVKQRISKEFGVHYECDDETLKKAIRNSSNDYYKYFVLAAALNGNELALATVRKGFLGFGRCIIEGLYRGTPQDRNYIAECVNSDTVGKIIRDLAWKGNSYAIEILQMA